MTASHRRLLQPTNVSGKPEFHSNSHDGAKKRGVYKISRFGTRFDRRCGRRRLINETLTALPRILALIQIFRNFRTV